MIEPRAYAKKTVAVLGLGRSGLSAARALKSVGANVLAWDDNPQTCVKANAAGIDTTDLADANWQEIDALVLSPGIPHTYPHPHPVVLRARDAGCPVIGDIELFATSRPAAPVIGITGTNGKSTTTALIGYVAHALGKNAVVGGNLGMPVMDFDSLPADGVYVLEMSSYQLELTHTLTFDVAVWLNISADHLDRHGGLDGYIQAKRRIFNGQGKGHIAVIGVDDDASRAVFDAMQSQDTARVIPVSAMHHVAGGVYVEDGMMIDALAGAPAPVLDMRSIAALPGVHNAQNACAAYAALRSMGWNADQIADAMQSFPGLAHRQELVDVIDGVSYINDSKATNMDAVARALVCYAPIYWIAGGRAKEDGPEVLAQYFDRVRHGFLIGEAAEPFANVLAGKIKTTISGDLKSAVFAARECALADAQNNAQDGAVVLLSPGCASFDQFDNFEARGEAFRNYVHALPGVRDVSSPSKVKEA